MKETKVELNQRKVRNGIRKQKEVRQKIVWDKLTAVSKPAPKIDFTLHNKTVTAIPRTIKAGWTQDSEGLIHGVDKNV